MRIAGFVYFLLLALSNLFAADPSLAPVSLPVLMSSLKEDIRRGCRPKVLREVIEKLGDDSVPDAFKDEVLQILEPHWKAWELDQEFDAGAESKAKKIRNNPSEAHSKIENDWTHFECGTIQDKILCGFIKELLDDETNGYYPQNLQEIAQALPNIHASKVLQEKIIEILHRNWEDWNLQEDFYIGEALELYKNNSLKANAVETRTQEKTTTFQVAKTPEPTRYSAQPTTSEGENLRDIKFELGIVFTTTPSIKFGLGTLITVGNTCAVATAAHVVVGNAAKNIIFVTIENQGPQKYQTYLVNEAIIHPEFISAQNKIHSGFDVAILKVALGNINKNKCRYFYELMGNPDMFTHCGVMCNDESISQLSSQTSIYPGALRELELQDSFFMAILVGVSQGLREAFLSGRVFEIYDGESSSGEILAYKGLSTQDGHSGAPIFRRIGSHLEFIAIHVGLHEECNFGFATLITKNIKSWIMETIGNTKKPEPNKN